MKNGARGCSSRQPDQRWRGKNNLNIRVYGSEGSLRWHQENPNYLYVAHPGEPVQVFSSRQRLPE